MTPEAYNVAIAEWRGWTNIDFHFGLKGLRGQNPGRPYGCLSKIPNYFGSLDAVAEPEGALTLQQKFEYTTHLGEILGLPESLLTVKFDYVHASAPQRCEAILRTIGKWREDS